MSFSGFLNNSDFAQVVALIDDLCASCPKLAEEPKVIDSFVATGCRASFRRLVSMRGDEVYPAGEKVRRAYLNLLDLLQSALDEIIDQDTTN